MPRIVTPRRFEWHHLRSDDVDLVITTMAKTIVDNADYFAQLDAVAGDGDFGYSLRNGFEVVLERLRHVRPDRASGSLLKKVGFVIASKVGGVSGPIWGTAFLRAAAEAGDRTELTPDELIAILRAAVARDHAARRGVARRQDPARRARPGDRQPRGEPDDPEPDRRRRRRRRSSAPPTWRPRPRRTRGDARDARTRRVHRRAQPRLGRRRCDRDRRDPPGISAAWREKYTNSPEAQA